jgi:hypothetical protein
VDLLKQAGHSCELEERVVTPAPSLQSF